MHSTTSVKLPPKPSQGLTGSEQKVWKFVVRARSKKSSHMFTHSQISRLLHMCFENTKGCTKTHGWKFTIAKGTRAPCYRLGWRNKNRWSLSSERQSAHFESSKVEKGRKGWDKVRKGAEKQQRQWRQHWWWHIVSANVLIVDMHVNIYIYIYICMHTSLQCSILTRFPFRTALLSCTMAADCHVDLEITIYIHAYVYISDVYTYILSKYNYFCIPLAVPPENLLSHLLPGHTLQSWTTKSWKKYKMKK